MTDHAAELARCDAEIERAAKGECIGAAIGWADWSVERRLILEEMRMRQKRKAIIFAAVMAMAALVWLVQR